MKKINIPYTIQFDRIDNILYFLDLERENGLEIKELGIKLNYSDATGISMHIRFLLESDLATKPSQSLIKITKLGIEYLHGNIDLKNKILIDHMSSGLIEVVQILGMSQEPISIEDLFSRLQKKYGTETNRVLEYKISFTKKFLERTGLVEFIKTPQESFKITSKGSAFIDSYKNRDVVNESEKSMEKVDAEKVNDSGNSTEQHTIPSVELDENTEKSSNKNEQHTIPSVELEENTEKSSNKNEAAKDLDNDAEKVKSRQYPYYSLKESIDFVRDIKKIAGNGIASTQAILKFMGISSEYNRRFSYSKSSASQFGLIEVIDVGIKIKPLGDSIIKDNSTELLRKAFFSVRLYQEIYDKYQEHELPNKEILKLIFQDFSIIESVAERAVDVFLTSGEFAQTIKNNHFTPRIKQKADEQSNKSNQVINTNTTTKQNLIQEDSDECNEKSKKIEFPTRSGKKIIIFLPEGCSLIDIDNIKKILDIYIQGMK